jgi:hypothetical protein
MITVRKICGCGWFNDPEEFYVPMDTRVSEQSKPEINRSNRLLPIGHRCRGDVA